MSFEICPNCGGKSFRADRALAGKVICNKCSTPLGSKPFRKRSKVSRASFYINKKVIYLTLFLLILILVFISSQ